MKRISELLHWLDSQRIKLLLRFEPKTFGQLSAWVWLNEHTDLSYIENMIEWRLQYGVKWKNSF